MSLGPRTWELVGRLGEPTYVPPRTALTGSATQPPSTLEATAQATRCAAYRYLVILIAVAAAALASHCGKVSAGPRTWAAQGASQGIAPGRQPAWMPLRMADRTPNPAVARITAVEPQSLSQGSGTLVEVRGEQGLVVTNWHVIRDAKGPITATFPDGFRSAATVLKIDRDWDLAALLIWRPNTAPLAIATTAPRPGDPLTIAGYGTGNYRAVTGRCTQYVAPGARMPYEMVEVSAEARQGDSGGPILNQQGELAGVLFGAAGGTTSGSFCGRVRWFLESAWPAEQAAGGDVLVSAVVAQPTQSWPSDSLAAVPQTPAAAPRAGIEPTPNYSIGSTLPPATISAGQLEHPESATRFQVLAGTTPLEQAKTALAAIGVLSVLVQATKVFGRRRRSK